VSHPNNHLPCANKYVRYQSVEYGAIRKVARNSCSLPPQHAFCLPRLRVRPARLALPKQPRLASAMSARSEYHLIPDKLEAMLYLLIRSKEHRITDREQIIRKGPRDMPANPGPQFLGGPDGCSRVGQNKVATRR